MRKDRKVNNDSIQVNYEDYPFIITVMLVILCGAYKLWVNFDSTIVQLPFDSTSIQFWFNFDSTAVWLFIKGH